MKFNHESPLHHDMAEAMDKQHTEFGCVAQMLREINVNCAQRAHELCFTRELSNGYADVGANLLAALDEFFEGNRNGVLDLTKLRTAMEVAGHGCERLREAHRAYHSAGKGMGTSEEHVDDDIGEKLKEVFGIDPDKTGGEQPDSEPAPSEVADQNDGSDLDGEVEDLPPFRPLPSAVVRGNRED